MELRQQQQRMLSMLLFLDDICRKHNISYWLSSGTLLGAVRHGGFIPWDDDLDVEMLRPDYLKLLSVLGEQDEYALQTYKTDPYYRLPFAKLRDKHSLVEEYGRDAKYLYRGLFLDIFSLEYTHDFPSRVVARLLRFISFFAVKGDSRLRHHLFLLFKGAIFMMIPLVRFLSSFFPGKQLRHTIGTPYRAVRRMDEIFPLEKIEFEGHSMPCPRDSHAYLTRIFGDYMKLPPEEQRIPHNTKVTSL